MPFAKELLHREKQTVMHSIWTQFIDSISYNYIHYLKSTAKKKGEIKKRNIAMENLEEWGEWERYTKR